MSKAITLLYIKSASIEEPVGAFFSDMWKIRNNDQIRQEIKDWFTTFRILASLIYIFIINLKFIGKYCNFSHQNANANFIEIRTEGNP